jgi:hypothetical protein
MRTLQQKIELAEKTHRHLMDIIKTDRYRQSTRIQHRGIIARLERLYNEYRETYGADYTSEGTK